MIGRWLTALAALVCALMLAGCAGGPATQQSAAAGGAAPAAAVAQVQGDDYVIGAGDTVPVFVLRNPELTSEVPVRPDGKISTPLVKDMVAVGKTTSQLAHDIELVLGDFLRSPSVSIIVTRAAGAYSQIRVVGQAVSPRAIPFRAGMTVLDVMIEVGGLSRFAAGNRAKIVRVKDGRPVELHVRLADLLDKGDVSQNMVMQPGDVLVVPEARF